MQVLDVLKRIELFRGLNDDRLQQIAAISQQEIYNDDEVILNVDKPGDTLYIIGRGEVEIHLPAEGGELRPALYLGEGQIFGEMALLEGAVRSATVVAAGDNTLVYQIQRDDFIALCQADTQLGYLVMRNLAQDLSFKLRHRNVSNSY